MTNQLDLNKMAKSDLIDIIEFYFREKGQRLTNMRRVDKQKLLNIVTKYKIDVEAVAFEINQSKIKANEEHNERIRKQEEQDKEEQDHLTNIYMNIITVEQRNSILLQLYDDYNFNYNLMNAVSKNTCRILKDKLIKDNQSVESIDYSTLKINGIHVSFNGIDTRKIETFDEWKRGFKLNLAITSKLMKSLLTKFYNDYMIGRKFTLGENGKWFMIIKVKRNKKQ